MKCSLHITFLLSLLLAGLPVTGFRSPQEEAGHPVGPVKACLGHSEASGGKIPKSVFDSLLKQGITAKDSLGNLFQVQGFYFSYGERSLYEDSIGNLIVMTDYLTEFCPGDTISSAIAHTLFTRTKRGDTAYFDNIKVISQDGAKQYGAKGMMFILTP